MRLPLSDIAVGRPETIALAHDLGHSPFGHSGEEMLAECMREQGGFDHNRQSLRVVELLESAYSDFPGLNLTFEVREGLRKHQTSYDPPGAPAVYQRPSLEAQIADGTAATAPTDDTDLFLFVTQANTISAAALPQNAGIDFFPFVAARERSAFDTVAQVFAGQTDRMVRVVAATASGARASRPAISRSTARGCSMTGARMRRARQGDASIVRKGNRPHGFVLDSVGHVGRV